MRFIYFFGLVLSLQLHAHEPNCDNSMEIVKLDAFNGLLKEINWHGADDAQILKAKCKHKEVPTQKEIVQYLSKVGKDSSSGKVHGVSLTGESSQMINAFKDLTTHFDSFGIVPDPKHQVNIQKTYAINPSCKKVLCAVEKIWGKDMGPKLLYMYLKHGYNGSELAFANSSAFTPDELNNVIIGLEDLPQTFVPLGKNQRLTHFSRGYTLASYGDGVVANAVIMLFDLFDSESGPQKQYTIYHELAHNISTKLADMDENPEWLKESGWIKKGQKWSAPKSACFISEYGKTNPWEDFAEAVTTYRYNPGMFKKTCPKKYQFVKQRIYNGLEYLSEEQCSPVPLDKIKIAREKILSELLNSREQLPIDQAAINQNCVGVFEKLPINEESINKCSERIFSAKPFSIDESSVGKILIAAGIRDTSFNRSLVQGDLLENIKDSPELKKKAHLGNDQVLKIVNASIQQTLADAAPKALPSDLSNPDDGIWSFIIRSECSGEMLKKSTEDLSRCVVEKIIAQDKKKSSWGVGYFPRMTPNPLLSKDALAALSETRYANIAKWLIESKQTAPVISVYRQKFKNDLLDHFKNSNFQLEYYKKRRDWKKEAPDEFCKNHYARESIYLRKWSDQAESFPDIQIFCLEKQQGSRRRVKLKDEDFKMWVDKTYP